jgi:enoyl-CoA hydratase/carnithine racemase
MAEEPIIRIERRGAVAIVTIDRPERRNALGRAAWLELRGVIRDVRDDDGVTGMILTGSGDRSFAAGADIRELVDRPPWVALAGLVQGILRELEDLPIPTIAAMNGHALGGGWELALACDFRVAARHARVGFPETGLGIIPGGGGARRLAQHVGVGRAKELIMLGTTLEAPEAHALGLVHRVADPPDDPLTMSIDLMRELGTRSAFALRMAKTVLNRTAYDEPDLERLAYTLTYLSDDRSERMRRFLDRSAGDRGPAPDQG